MARARAGRAFHGVRRRSGCCARSCTNLAATGSWSRTCWQPPAPCRASTAAPAAAATASAPSQCAPCVLLDHVFHFFQGFHYLGFLQTC